MRRTIVFLAPVSLCLLALFACEDDTDVGSGTFNLDAGNLDVLVPPTPRTDASTDGGTDSAGPAPLGVNVAVLGSATARANVEVVFQYADGTLETTRTGVDGTATSTGATTPAMATALLSGQGRFTPFTWTGVVAGDVLSVPAIEDTSAIGTFNVAAAAKSNGQVNGLRIEATSVCGTTQTIPIGAAFAASYPVDVSPTCIPASGKAALLAKETASGVISGFAFLKALDVPAAAGTAETLGAWATPTTLTIAVTNPPATTFYATQIAELYDGATFDVQNGVFITGQQTLATFNVAAGFASAYQASMSITTGTNVQQQMLQQTTTALSFDLSAVLPVLSNPTVTGNPVEPDFGWDGDTATTTIGGAVQFGYQGTQTKSSYIWTIFVPAGTTTVHLPKLPADASAFAPISTSSLDGSYTRPEVVFLQASGLTAASLRGKLSTFPDITVNGLLNATRYAPLPAPGLYRVTALEQN